MTDVTATPEPALSHGDGSGGPLGQKPAAGRRDAVGTLGHGDGSGVPASQAGIAGGPTGRQSGPIDPVTPSQPQVDERAVAFRYVGIADQPPSLTDYHRGWELQREIHARVAGRELGPQVLYVEHPPVYTAGRRTEPHERPVDGTPVVDVDRGGKITYHGPGQLVGYPIVFLPRGIGVVDYVRRVEEALIRLLAEYGIRTGRVPGRTGVWLAAEDTRPERKIAAIGIRVSRQTTMHGFALNVTSDLGYFGQIVPCGITDAGVTSMADELGGHTPSLLDVAHRLEPHLTELLRFEPYTPSPDLAALASARSVTFGLTI